jgi:hypothetical protein
MVAFSAWLGRRVSLSSSRGHHRILRSRESRRQSNPFAFGRLDVRRLECEPLGDHFDLTRRGGRGGVLPGSHDDAPQQERRPHHSYRFTHDSFHTHLRRWPSWSKADAARRKTRMARENHDRASARCPLEVTAAVIVYGGRKSRCQLWLRRRPCGRRRIHHVPRFTRCHSVMVSCRSGTSAGSG